MKRASVVLVVSMFLLGLLATGISCTNTPTTSTPTGHLVIQNESDAQTAVWTHLRGLVQTDQGETIYNAALDNIYRQDSYVCTGNVSDYICPENSWYFTLDLYIDKGSGTMLLPRPYAWISTIVSTGRQIVYFGWIVESDGTVYPCNPYAKWLEEVIQTPTISPTSTPAHPNTGSVTGCLLFVDNTPAYPNSVYIFKSGAFTSTATASVNTEGDYSFSGLPVGDYEIYAAIYRDYSLQTPDAKISVYDQQVTTVPLIIVPRHVDKVCCNGSEISYKNSHIAAVQPSLSWTVITGAHTYSVTINSDHNATPPGPIGYDKVAMTTETNIVWPTLQPGSYKIVIRAFDQQNTLVGIGSTSFIVD